MAVLPIIGILTFLLFQLYEKLEHPIAIDGHGEQENKHTI